VLISIKRFNFEYGVQFFKTITSDSFLTPSEKIFRGTKFKNCWK